MTAEGIELGNFIWVYDHAEMVTELLLNENTNTVRIGHGNHFESRNPIPEGILFEPEPIEITEEWLNALGLYGFGFPNHIKFVHEAQNYARWVYKITIEHWNFDLIEEINRKYLQE